MRMDSCSRVWDVGGLWILYRFFLVLLSKIKNYFWEINSTHTSDLSGTYYRFTITQRFGTGISQANFTHAYTENWTTDPSIQRAMTIPLDHAEGWKHGLSGWCLFYGREQVIHAGSGARFSVELGQWEGFELSVRSIFFPSTFCFRHVVIKSQTRAQTNVMETIDISTADTKVILAVYLSW